MAALMRHGALRIHITARTTHVPASGGFATRSRKGRQDVDKKQPPRIHPTAESMAAKGFLRPQKSYTPPADVQKRLEAVFRRTLRSQDQKAALGDLEQKFRLCSACAKEFDHPIPNSLLHTMETLNDVKKFYHTPVETSTPLDKMRYMDLPENLHVQFDYHRFNPETDTMFKGQTAFNRSSTLVTGLKYKDKYKGHVQNQQWPFNS